MPIADLWDAVAQYDSCNQTRERTLSTFHHEKIQQELVKCNCDWIDFKMNVPEASHMGGAWERQIRTVRNVLATLLTQHAAQLDDETLKTFMVEAKAIVNSRPLTVDAINSPQMPEPLMPNHLLTSKVILPPPGEFQRADLYSKKRWRRVQYLANEDKVEEGLSTVPSAKAEMDVQAKKPAGG